MHDPVDFYAVMDELTPAQRAAWDDLRALATDVIDPVADRAWLEGRFPMEVIPAFGRYAEKHLAADGYQWPPADPVRMGLVKLELGRRDPSMASFFAVHWGLAMSSIHAFGSPEQHDRWIGPMTRFEKIGSFALSEPEVGSDAARGLRCVATPERGGWRLDGQKKWSGNATFADVIVVIANAGERAVHGFLLEPGTPGLHIARIDDKIAKRSVENVVITLDGCWVPESARLPKLASFGAVAQTLAMGRFAVAWEACGIAMGAYEAAHRYAMGRQQFGKPIAGFQLVQAKLVDMLQEITASQCLLMQLGRLAERGALDAGRASLAKVQCAGAMRRVVATAREVLGGNGILLEYGVAKLFADAEAVYSYEGTQDMNTLIVGKHITGLSAFV
jgi:glutaryl-CoA dehydrogenase